MGVVRSSESFEAEVDEFKREMMTMMMTIKPSSSSSKGRRDDDDVELSSDAVDPQERMTICVTSGISFLGFAIANRLLSRGYNLRLLLHSQEDLEKVREMGETMFDDERASSSRVVEDMMDVDGLCEAFAGCVAVFHTSSFSDPSGVSGYSKHMAEVEARTTERVIEACVRTPSVRKCVFTSSLLACIWRHNSLPTNRVCNRTVDENWWSDESLCRDKKLWLALGKTMAEKAAWRSARGRDLKLVTLCPGLVTGPGFRRRNSTASIAYLKGAQDMLRDGLLATVDVGKLAEAHVRVYEAMDRTACGRYICFDHVIRRVEDVTELERQLGIPNRTWPAVDGSGSVLDQTSPANWCELSKRKLTRLMSSSSRRCSYSTLR